MSRANETPRTGGTPPPGALDEVLGEQGFERVAGVDEAGRGALAGPLVAAAVILPGGWVPEGLADSKLLTPGERDRLHGLITTRASVGIRRVRPGTVDRVGLQEANRRALRGALSKLEPAPDYALIDGRFGLRPRLPCLNVIKGDRLSAAVAAASVVAKVTRDRRMIRMGETHPGYGFERHKGYTAPEHLDALAELGPCPSHRRCFAPVAQLRLDVDAATATRAGQGGRA